MNNFSQWFSVLRVGKNYNTMHYFNGTGGNTFDIHFAGGYLDKSHVKAVADDGGPEISLSFVTASRVKTSRPIPLGSSVLIFRDTPKALPLALFNDGAVITATNLDRNAKQAVFVAAEMLDRFDTFGGGLESAVSQVSEALSVAHSALEVAAKANEIAEGLEEEIHTASELAVDLKSRIERYSGTVSPNATGLDVPAHVDTTLDVQVQAIVNKFEYLKGANGASNIGVGNRTVADKLREKTTPLDKGAVGDGVTNDQVAFDALESDSAVNLIDCLGKTYLINAISLTKKYVNGVITTVGGATWVCPSESMLRAGNASVLVGRNVAPALRGYENETGSETRALFAMGDGALASATPQTKQCIAIGRNTLGTNVLGYYDIGIGLDCLMNLNGDGATSNGTRVVGIGDNLGRFSVSIFDAVLMGRNTAQCQVSGGFNTMVGSNANSGYAPVNQAGTIINETPMVGASKTGFGYRALQFSDGNNVTAAGSRTAKQLKKGQANSFFGALAGGNVDNLVDFSGNTREVSNTPLKYTQSGNVISITATAHGAVIGGKVYISFTSGPAAEISTNSASYVVSSVIDANNFTVTSPDSKTATGTGVLDYVVSLSPASPSEFNNGFGYQALLSTGGYSFSNCNAFGVDAGRDNRANNLSAFGHRALMYNMTGMSNSAFGRDALLLNQDGSNFTSYTNCTGLGFQSAVSGNNQVQLGNSLTTTYVYGTVQNRSDANDKTDVRDTELGLEFIMGLRPVDGRWDMRDDYWEEYDEQVGVDATGFPVFATKRRAIPKDGSKKRERFHHWFIAQEVKELCDKLGVDFGGYQDHSTQDGGCDVLTLGYDEFIPPIVRAIQQVKVELDSINVRLSKLER